MTNMTFRPPAYCICQWQFRGEAVFGSCFRSSFVLVGRISPQGMTKHECMSIDGYRRLDHRSDPRAAVRCI